MKKKYTFRLGFIMILMAITTFVNGQTVYTFSNATATGISGPTQANVNAAYTATTLAGAVTVTAGIQEWVVPSSGNYSIQALGAAGGGINGGFGANIYGEFALTAGQVLQIIVGQQGSENDNGTGGGGGSYVVFTGNPFIVAGGGGGNHGVVNANCNGQVGQNGQGGMGTTTGIGGTAGNQGISTNRAQGGAGWLQDGPVFSQVTTNTAAKRFLNGGAGGFHNTSPGGLGGFGGGGGSWNTGFRGSAGGGGYSGGGTGSVSTNNNLHYGGGAGSFNSGTNQNNIAGTNLGMGSVIISSLCPVTIGSLVPDVPALADVTGSCSVTTTTPTATNNCGTLSGVSNVTLPITTPGTTVVTWTYDDGTNTVTQLQNIIVDPIVLTPDSLTLVDLLGTCFVQGNPINPTASNTCGVIVLGAPDVFFPITTPGTTVVTWTFTDGINTITQLQNVIITPIDNGISQVGAALSADMAGYSYQWLDCDNGNAMIPGETNQTYTPTLAGNYAVELTFDGCVDTSACVPYTLIGINELDNESFVMYPNPSNDGMFTISTTTPIIQINVVDALGRTIQLQADPSTGLINGSSLVAGKYIVRVITEDNVYTKQLMILK